MMHSRGPGGGFGPGIAAAVFKGAGKAAGRGGFEEEDRSRDWYCPKCRERNFVKRAECFKCRTAKPKDGDLTAPPRPTAPANGTTVNGMVKSYNRKGFGFLMCLGTDYGQDIYYTRENLSPRLQTRDIPGQHVTFEIHRFPDGKLTAFNIRPVGEDKDEPKGKAAGKGFAVSGFSAKGPGKDCEDRSRDWVCTSCTERNFVKRFECFKCKTSRGVGFTDAPSGASASAVERPAPIPPQRGLSPHAGSRAVREALAGGSRSRSRGRKKKKEKSKKRKRSRTRSSDSGRSRSSRSRDKRKKEGKKGKRRKSRTRSTSSSSRTSSTSKSSDCKMESGAAPAAPPPVRPPGGGGDPEVEAAKAEALEQLMKLRGVEPKEARMTEWRALLRKWHPDKNPDRVEVATAVFQFLQRGKALLDEAI